MIYTALIALLFSACEKEEQLTPSLLDVNRVEMLMEQQSQYGSQTLIEKWYATYKTGVLFEYQDTLDFIYQAGSQSSNNAWKNISFPQIRTLFEDEEGKLPADSIANYMAYVEQGLVFLDTTLFAYIKPGSTIAGMMPPKILMSASLSGSTSGGSYLIQGDYGVESSNSSNNFHSVFNAQAMVFNVNKENLKLGTENYIKDNFYLFICKLYTQNQLYSEFDGDIYEFSEPYFNKLIWEAYADEYGEDETQWTELTPNGKIPLSWFLSKGFVDGEGFNDFRFRTYTEGTESYNYIDAGDDATFLESKEEFILSYTNQLLYATYDKLNAYPDNIKTGLKLTANTLITWGIDLVAFNPELEQFLNQ